MKPLSLEEANRHLYNVKTKEQLSKVIKRINLSTNLVFTKQLYVCVFIKNAL